ncbi:MAG: ArnT family glycosyltransferase [Xanthobacter sp.]
MPISNSAPGNQTSARRTFAFDFPHRLTRLLDWASAGHGRACAFLVIVALVAFLPGLASVPPIDRDEARFAQATKQMLESGNYVDIRFHDVARHKKPVGIHWLQAASVTLGETLTGPDARYSIAFYRLPSLLAAIGVVLLTYWTSLVFMTRRGAVLAALLIGSCVLLGVEARLAKTDAVLLFTIVAAFGALARAYMRPREQQVGDWGLAAIFWTAMAAGILVKGPMTPLFVGLTVVVLAVLERSGRFLKPLRPLPGVIWCLLLVLPWFVAIYYVTNGAFYQHAVGVDMLGKVTEGQEGHWGPPGTYLLAVWGTYWPSIVMAVLAVPFVWRARREKSVRFLLSWLLPSWIAFELAATKLPHYVLPVYPALALLTALAVERGALAKAGSRLAGFVWFWPGLAAVLGIVFAGIYIWLGSAYSLLACLLLLLAVVLLVIAARAYGRIGPESALLTAICGALVLYVTVYQLMLPNMRPVWVSNRLAEIAAESGCPAGNIVSVPYQEPSLVFLVGTDIHYEDPVKAAERLKAGGCRLAFIGEPLAELFALRAKQIGLKYETVTEVRGFTINGGRPVTIMVYRPLLGEAVSTEGTGAAPQDSTQPVFAPETAQ